MAAGPVIQALIINPDGSHELRDIDQDLSTWQQLVGGYIEDIKTEHCVFWADEEGKLKDYPCNDLATYMWWNLAPHMEGRDVLQGTIFVTGDADGEWSKPVPPAIIDLFRRIEQLAAEAEEETEA